MYQNCKKYQHERLYKLGEAVLKSIFEEIPLIQKVREYFEGTISYDYLSYYFKHDKLFIETAKTIMIKEDLLYFTRINKGLFVFDGIVITPHNKIVIVFKINRS